MLTVEDAERVRQAWRTLHEFGLGEILENLPNAFGETNENGNQDDDAPTWESLGRLVAARVAGLERDLTLADLAPFVEALNRRRAARQRIAEAL